MRMMVVPLLCVGAGFALLFGETFRSAIAESIALPSSQGHSVVVLALAAFMIWSRRADLRARAPAPAPVSGGLLLLAGCVLMILGEITLTGIVCEGAMVVGLLGLTLLMFGGAWFRVLFLPVAYLVFMFPLAEMLPGEWIMLLQKATMWIAVGILKTCGLPLLCEGIDIELPHITLRVARSCSGTNQIMSLMALAVLLGYTQRLNKRATAFLVGSMFVTGVAANGLRVALIGIWTNLYPEAEVHGPSDLLVMPFVFGTGLAVLLLLSFAGGRFFGSQAPPSVEAEADPAGASTRRGSVWAAAGVAVVLTAGTWGLLENFRVSATPLAADLDGIALELGPWQGRDVEVLGEPFDATPCDARLERTYIGPAGTAVNVYIAYFAVQRPGEEIFAFDSILNNGAAARLVAAEGTVYQARRFEYRHDSRSRQGYAWYMVGGELLASRYRAKLVLLRRIVTRRTGNAGLVIVTGDNPGGSDGGALGEAIKDFTALLAPEVARFFQCAR